MLQDYIFQLNNIGYFSVHYRRLDKVRNGTTYKFKKHLN